MNIVDWVLIGVLIVFAWAGWRQGFIAGLLSFIGFIGGGLLAAFILPDVIVQRTDSGFLRVAVLAISIILCAILGQLLTSFSVGVCVADSLGVRCALLTALPVRH